MECVHHHLLSALMDTIPDRIYFKDQEGRFILANKALLSLVGMTHNEEIVGKTDFDLFQREYALRTRADENEIIRTGKTIRDKVGKKTLPDGTTAWTSTTKVSLRDSNGNITGICGITRDITEHKQAEEANQHIMAAIDQSAESIVFTDAQGTIFFVNQGFEKVTGYTRQEVLGLNPRFLNSGKQSAEFYKNMWGTILRGEVWNGRFTNQRKDGTLYEEEASITPIRNDEGKITSFVAVKRDVTREIELERQFIEAQKMEAVGRLAGGVAHDYNNILAANMLLLDFLLSKPELTSDLRESLQCLKNGAERAARLTRQLLTFSRKQAMQVRSIDLRVLVNGEMEMLRRLLGENIDLVFQIPDGDLWIEADSGMIEQVVMNLCINARDAMPKGGRLTVRLEKREFDPAKPLSSIEARSGQFICLSVADTGCGMDEETRRRVFEPFFTTKKVGKGTGLGLATVYGIAKQHNGWIEVTSEMKKGTEFRVFLPLGTAKHSAAADSRTPQIHGGIETILVVEDDEEMRKVLVLSLKMSGYRVWEARNGPEALQTWSGRLDQIDLVLTDMIMPGGMDGLDLCGAFTKLKPTLPLMIMSGYSSKIARSPIPERSGFAYLQKPFDIATLTAAVRKALGKSASP